jgi:transposase
MPKKIDPAVRERVMRMVADHRGEYSTPTELAKIAAREQIGRQAVRRWIVQADVDVGARPGVSSEDSAAAVVWPQQLVTFCHLFASVPPLVGR